MSLLDLERLARELGAAARRIIPKNTGFAVLVFDFGGKGHMTYVSNAQRADMIVALREQIAHLETGVVAPAGQPNHPANKPGQS